MNDHTEPSPGPRPSFLGRSLPLLKRQHRDWIGPQYVFTLFVDIDLLIRMSLLIGMPETLHAHFK